MAWSQVDTDRKDWSHTAKQRPADFRAVIFVPEVFLGARYIILDWGERNMPTYEGFLVDREQGRRRKEISVPGVRESSVPAA